MDPSSLVYLILNKIQAKIDAYADIQADEGVCSFSAVEPEELKYISPAKPITANMDIASTNSLATILKTVLENLSTYGQELQYQDWKNLFQIMLNISAKFPIELNWAKSALSLLLIGSRNDSELLMTVIDAIPTMSFVEYCDSLPSEVLMVLSSRNAQGAFRSVNGAEGFTENYHIPPTIAVVNIPKEYGIYGWVGFGNEVIIFHFNFPSTAIWSSIEKMNIASIIGHETQHGLLRMARDNYNVHSPTLHPAMAHEKSAESGFRWECAMFFGRVFYWDKARNISVATRIIDHIFNQLHETQSFTLTESAIRTLHACFPSTEKGAEGGPYYRTGKVYR